MSRKAVTNLVTVTSPKSEDYANERSEPFFGVSVVPSGSAEIAAQRQSMLQNYTPKPVDVAAMAVIRPQMIDAILQVGFTSTDTDNAMARAFYLFGHWCLRTHGGFDAASDLNFDMFDAFQEQGLRHYGGSSESTHMSALRRIHRKRPAPRRSKDVKPATAPFTQQQWESLRKAASEAGNYANDAITLLVLSGGLGMSSQEINASKGSWVHFQNNQTSITITHKNQQRRELPVYGADAEWLLERIFENPHGHLFRPNLENRTNAIGHMVYDLGRAHGEFRGFTVLAARHKWFLDLLTARIPFHIACVMAGVGHDSKLPTNLLLHAPQVRIQDMRLHLEDSNYVHAYAHLNNHEGTRS